MNRVFDCVAGTFEVMLEDTNADKIVGIDFFPLREAAIEYAKGRIR
jgi:hypothetical protein